MVLLQLNFKIQFNNPTLTSERIQKQPHETSLICSIRSAKQDPALAETSPLLKCRNPVLLNTHTVLGVTWPRNKYHSLHQEQSAHRSPSFLALQRRSRGELSSERAPQTSNKPSTEESTQGKRSAFLTSSSALFFGLRREQHFMALTYGAEFQGKYPVFEEVQRLPSSQACRFLLMYLLSPITNAPTILKEIAKLLTLSEAPINFSWRPR